MPYNPLMMILKVEWENTSGIKAAEEVKGMVGLYYQNF